MRMLLGLLPAIALLSCARGLEPARLEPAAASPRPADPPAANAAPGFAEDAAPVAARAPIPDPDITAPVERAALELRLVDARTGQRFAGCVLLYRLDLPESETLTAGDELVGEHDVPREGLRLEGLAPGRYRASCPQRRHDAQDPPAFELTAPRCRVTLDVDRPRERAAHLALVDGTGARIEEAELHSSVPSTYDKCDLDPDWPVVRERKTALPSDAFLGRRFGGGGTSTACGGWRDVRAGARGFELGDFREDPADRRTVHTARLRARDVELRCRIEGRQRGELRYAALVPSREDVLASVRLPDGRAAREVAPRVALSPVVRRLEDEAPEDVWRALEVQVVVQHSEYERLDFRWSPATAAETRWLEPRRVDDDDE